MKSHRTEAIALLNPLTLHKVRTKLLLILLLGTGSLAHGQITLTFSETNNGNDLTISASGNFQLDFTYTHTEVRTHIITTDVYQRVESTDGTWSYWGTNVITGAPPPLAENLNISGTRSGDKFGYLWEFPTGSFVVGPQGFQTGDYISGSITFDNFNFASAGLTDGTSGNFTIGPQQYSWSVGSITAVPEPSTYAAISLALMGMLLFMKRRKGN